MNTSLRPRLVVPAAAAILLTFGRDGIMPTEKVYTILDQSMNVFVVIIAPVFALKDIYPRLLTRNLYRLLAFLVLALWVSVCLFVGSSEKNWPSGTVVITIAVSILLVSQISRSELSRLRHIILLLAGLFTLEALIFSQSSLNLIFSGMVKTRLGAEESPANVIMFPRVMYMLVVTCLVSLVIEKNIWIRIWSAATMILPILLALATGGRGPLVGLVVAAIVFVIGLRTRKSFYAVLAVGVIAVIGQFLVSDLIPIMERRIVLDNDSGRLNIWSNLLDTNVSLFGRGATALYPHNIFLEFLYDYGIVGLVLFLIVLTTTVVAVYKYYSRTHDEESLWVICLLVLQMTAQQFSLNIYYAPLWAAMVLPLGFSWDFSRGPEKREGIMRYLKAAPRNHVNAAN